MVAAHYSLALSSTMATFTPDDSYSSGFRALGAVIFVSRSLSSCLPSSFNAVCVCACVVFVSLTTPFFPCRLAQVGVALGLPAFLLVATIARYKQIYQPSSVWNLVFNFPSLSFLFVLQLRCARFHLFPLLVSCCTFALLSL